MKKLLKKEYFFLLLILLVGLILRLPGVLTNSFAYTYDVGRDMLALHSIVYDHKVPLIGPTTGFQGIFYGPWWYYILTVPFILSGGNPQFISFFIGLLGLGAAVLIFLAGKRIGGNFLGLMLAAFVSFSPVLVTVQIWNPYLAYPMIALLFLCFSYIFMKDATEKQKLLAFLTAGISLGLIIDSEIFFGTLFTAGIVLSSAILLFHELNIKKLGLFIVGLFIILSPRILFEFRHQFLMTKSFLTLITQGIPQTHYTPFLNRERYIWDVFFTLWSYTVANKIVSIGVLLLVGSVICYVLYLKKTTQHVRRFLLLAVGILSAFVLYFSTNSTDIFDHFLVGIPLIFILLVSLSIYVIYTCFNKYLAISIVAILSYLLISPLTFIHDLQKPLWEGDGSVYRNTLAVVDYIYADARGKSFSTIIFTPTNQDDTYRYLFLWYGQKKYHYQPVSDQKVRYVILEPDNQYKGFRTKIWLDEHKDDGKVITEKKLKGGIIVQKRIFE